MNVDNSLNYSPIKGLEVGLSTYFFSTKIFIGLLKMYSQYLNQDKNNFVI